MFSPFFGGLNGDDYYPDDPFDDAGGAGYDYGFNTYKRKQPQCRNCGSKDVYWHQYPSGKWFLFTGKEAHKCKT